MRPKGECGIGRKGWTAGYRVGKLCVFQPEGPKPYPDIQP
jgi:hypothetical protein